MKILVVTDPKIPISKISYSGSTLLPYNLSKSLVSKYTGTIVDLLVYNDLDTCEVDGINIVDLGEPKARYQLQVYKKLMSIIDDYDIVHVHISTPGFVKYLVEMPEEYQRKIIYTMHTGTRTRAVGYYYYEYFNKLVTSSEINIAFITKRQAEDLLITTKNNEFYNPDRITYIYNSVPIIPTHKNDDENYAIAVGRMVESKNIDKIIKACIESNQKLLLVSPVSGPSNKDIEYQEYVFDLISNAPKNLIQYSEGMTNTEILGKISKASVGILFSDFEVFGLFILECLYQETPILVRDISSLQEVLNTYKDAGVTTFKSYNQLVSLLVNKTYHLADINNIPENCTYSEFVDQYYNLYSKVYAQNV